MAGPWTFGKPEGKGKRNDLHVKLLQFKNDVISGAVTRDTAPWHPDYASFYMRNREHMNQLFSSAVSSAAPRKLPPARWHPWQQAILDKIAEPADDRTVFWIYDKEGGAGKTILTEYLVSNGIGYSSPVMGKFGDIIHQWSMCFQDQPRVIILDVPRDVGESTNIYNVAEKFKDGSAVSVKYNGGRFSWNPTHTIVFSNDVPTAGRLSKDRLENSMYTIVEHPVTMQKELRSLPYSACKPKVSPNIRVNADVLD